jgi:hypothetical protein
MFCKVTVDALKINKNILETTKCLTKQRPRTIWKIWTYQLLGHFME